MRKYLWIILAALFVSVGASSATADSYNVTFQCTGTCTAPALPVATNNPISFPSPTINVLWEGNEFGLTFQNPGEAASDPYIWDAALDISIPGINTFSVTLIFSIVDSNTGMAARDEVNTAFEGPVVPEVEDTGTLVITPTPEPGSAAFMLVGVGLIGLLLVFGRRIAQKRHLEACGIGGQ